jgi:hypothetical protein
LGSKQSEMRIADSSVDHDMIIASLTQENLQMAAKREIP